MTLAIDEILADLSADYYINITNVWSGWTVTLTPPGAAEPSVIVDRPTLVAAVVAALRETTG